MKTPAIWIIKGANSAIFIFIYCALISEYSRGQKRCHRLYKLGKKTCGHKKTKPQNETLADFAQKKINGCSGRDRTYDQVINSHLLYRWATEQSLMRSVILCWRPLVNTFLKKIPDKQPISSSATVRAWAAKYFWEIANFRAFISGKDSIGNFLRQRAKACRRAESPGEKIKKKSWMLSPKC